MLKTTLFSLFIPALLIGCTVTGPADDGWENNNEWVDTGRILPDHAKTIFSSEKNSGSNTESDSETVPQAKDSAPAQTPNSTDDADYLTYQQWLQAKDKNSAEYQKFKKWQEFEEFQRWKAQQGSGEK